MSATFNDSLAFVRRYRRSIAALARKHGECADDIAQDLHIYFPIWVKTFNPNRGASLNTYIFNKLSWHLRERRRVEFRHVTCELNDELDYQVDDEDKVPDLRDAPLPAGLPAIVKQTLDAARGCQTRGELAARLGISLRGLDKRLRRAEALASTREPVQFDLFDLELEGV